jgi:alkyl sulfatase BDS1-like metallo-beta-lactamase superfamily hydrolase
MPEKKILQSAEVIQGETFPNLYTIRGTTYRDPVQWYRTIDRLRALEPEYLVPSHGRPVEGKAEIAALLGAYRDAIQYTHDQAVRLINKGYTRDEVAAALPGLPPHLAAHPWVAEFYGTVRHSVRNVYTGYLGWFEGDPTTLDPTPPVERAKRTVALMGGRDPVLRAARNAAERGDHQWSAELATLLVRIDPKDDAARTTKAAALRQLAFRQININWRNFYLSAAKELDGTLDAARYDTTRGIAILSRLPLEAILENVVTRIDAEKARDVRLTLAFHTADTNRDYALEIRRGVVQLHRTRPPHVDATLTGDEALLRDVLLRQRSFVKELVVRGLTVDGGIGTVSTFFSYFDQPTGAPAALAAR